jgi:hypothetical protein
VNHDLFAPPPAPVPAPLDWRQIHLSRLDRTYRWALVPGTPLAGRDGPPEGFVLEYRDGDGWSPVNFWPRRIEVWNHLVKTGAIETDTTGHGPGREE